MEKSMGYHLSTNKLIQGYSNHNDDDKTIRGTQYKPIRDKWLYEYMSQFRMRYLTAECIKKHSHGFGHRVLAFHGFV